MVSTSIKDKQPLRLRTVKELKQLSDNLEKAVQKVAGVQRDFKLWCDDDCPWFVENEDRSLYGLKEDEQDEWEERFENALKLLDEAYWEISRCGFEKGQCERG